MIRPSNPHAWLLSDLASITSNGLKVMSTFACGGGSSMGYKRAGFEVIAANDIDPEMAWHYRLNIQPRHYFLCPIRNLLTANLPDDLFKLDILDGSPPCSTFSTVGTRERSWGKEKHFREGQAKQVLSDLFFDFLDLADRLKPRVIIAENVKGLIFGNAKGYVKLIFTRLREIGYRPQLFLLNAADCGVPQRRERVFFCAMRDDIAAPKLNLRPHERWISAQAACSDLPPLTEAERRACMPTPEALRFWLLTKPGRSFATAKKSLGMKETGFGRVRLDGRLPSATLTANPGDFYHWTDCRTITAREARRLGSFPDDYRAKSDDIGKYMIGMSVPPKMTEYVAKEVARQWLLPSRMAAPANHLAA